MKERENWLDIAKGIGIIAVVMGHSGNPIAHHFLFWFHMPLFFIISGYLFKEINNYHDLWRWIKKRTSQLLIPYALFGIMIAVILFLQNSSMSQFLTTITNLAYGGEILVGYFGVFWFITCLYLTQLLFAFIRILLKHNLSQICFIAFCYIVAHIIIAIPELRNIKPPWNFDVVLLAIVYYAIGFYGKSLLKTLSKKIQIMIVFFILTTLTVFLDILGFINFELDLKNNTNTYIGLDMIIPTLITTLIFGISYYLSKNNSSHYLERIGTASLTIMYLHIPLNIIFIDIFGYSNLFIYCLIGVAVPVFIHYFVLNKFAITKKLLLGQSIPSVNKGCFPN